MFLSYWPPEGLDSNRLIVIKSLFSRMTLTSQSPFSALFLFLLVSQIEVTKFASFLWVEIIPINEEML